MGKGNGSTRSSSSSSPRGIRAGEEYIQYQPSAGYAPPVSERERSELSTEPEVTRSMSFRRRAAQRARENESLEKAVAREARSLGRYAEVNTVREDLVSFYVPAERDRAGLRNQSYTVSRDNVSEYESHVDEYYRRIAKLSRRLFVKYPKLNRVLVSREV